ncbi:MAG: HD domain-containing protein [Anaerolineae bacterium]|nr:HD domain-containing protein [Anaerolineae bacterium]
MRYDDAVYGTVMIDEPVLLALLESKAMQRLHGVLQHGITALVGITRPVTRYEHSVGVMLLVRRFGGSLEEQVAALLHDVSHTAFSHVIDYVFNNHNAQSYHDEQKLTYVAQTGLPAVLEQFGFDWRHILDESAFPLLEQPAPRLCADRLDYFLRDSLDLALATPDAVRAVLSHLVVHDGRLMCDDVASARWLAETYLAADKASWANFREVGLYELTARALRRGLALGILTEPDIWEEDAVVWERLNAADDRLLQETLALVNAATRFVWDEGAPTFRVGTKLRTIDPEVVQPDKSVRPLSALDADFAGRREQYLEACSGLWPVRVVPVPE